MSRIGLFALSVFAAFVGAGTPVLAECVELDVPLGVGSTSADATWEIPRDGVCGGKIHGAWGHGGYLEFRSLKVSRRADHGVVGTLGSGRFAYKPDRGFVGSDRFGLSFSYVQRSEMNSASAPAGGAPGVAQIDVRVEVVAGAK